MPKFQINMLYPDGSEDLQDEIFETEEDATEYAGYLVSCTQLGAETLNMSNPGDYPYDEDSYEYPDYEIIETND